MLCQSCLHTASESGSIRIRFDFLRFCIRCMHFDKKGWGIYGGKKTEKRMRKFRTRCAMPLNLSKNENPIMEMLVWNHPHVLIVTKSGLVSNEHWVVTVRADYRLKGHLFDQIQTLCVVHPVDGFPVYPLPVRRHKRTSWATSQHYKYTKVVLSSGLMWCNELCWPPSAITFQHNNTTVWERGDPFTHLAECLHPPSVHLLSLHHSALKQITGHHDRLYDRVKLCVYRRACRRDFISWWWCRYEDRTYAGRRTHTNARTTHCRCVIYRWASSSKNVIYYSLLVTPF